MRKLQAIFGLDEYGNRRLRRAMEAVHENFIEIMCGGAALKAVARRKIVGPNRLIVAVRERGGRRTIAAAFGAMALPAFQLGEEFFSVLDAVQRHRRLSRNMDRIAGLLTLPSRGEGLDEGDQVRALLVGEGNPCRHV